MAKFPAAEQAHKFAKDVLAGKIPACRYVKLACQRHMDDLDASKRDAFPYWFDAKEA